ncbi:MAG: hypothetical protein AUH11_02000 [Acidobacteria bacterium 13_2_20CM_57_17]|nr:MAG: hypothetical protein AUH11_02000 [Acidobacteria bacterium 13_2_20CM_57_17]OLB97434.1 MAG: hypothetical protein AUI02_01030 [Acidobacteria bacterium 13_2_20CM_2_57_12]
MRILIDECIDERLRNALPGHDCQTARYAGFAGLKNGDLLIAAEKAKFDVFLTVDQGIEYQQNLAARKIAIITFRAKSNRLKDLLPVVPACLARIHSTWPGRHNRGLGLILPSVFQFLVSTFQFLVSAFQFPVSNSSFCLLVSSF